MFSPFRAVAEENKNHLTIKIRSQRRSRSRWHLENFRAKSAWTSAWACTSPANKPPLQVTKVTQRGGRNGPIPFVGQDSLVDYLHNCRDLRCQNLKLRCNSLTGRRYSSKFRAPRQYPGEDGHLCPTFSGMCF